MLSARQWSISRTAKMSADLFLRHLLQHPLLHAAAWSLLTVGFYFASKRLYRLWPRWWLTPLAIAPPVDRPGHTGAALQLP